MNNRKSREQAVAHVNALFSKEPAPLTAAEVIAFNERFLTEQGFVQDDPWWWWIDADGNGVYFTDALDRCLRRNEGGEAS